MNNLKKLAGVAVAAVADLQSTGDRLKDIAGKAEYNTAQVFVPATLIANIIIYILSFVGLIFLAMILYSGAKMIIAGGNDQEIESAKTRLKNAVIGFIVIALAFTILMFVRATILNVL